MDAIEFGMVSDTNEEHPWKHFSPIFVTELGIIKLFRFLQPSKQRAGKQFTSSGKSNDSINLFKMASSPFTTWKFSDIVKFDE
jgi:hypothetical protein